MTGLGAYTPFLNVVKEGGVCGAMPSTAEGVGDGMDNLI